MANRIRVGVIIPRYHPVFGGAENQCRLLCRALRDASHAEIPWILTMRLDPDWPQRETVDGVPVKRLGPSGVSRWSHYAFLAKCFLTLVARRQEYDLLHCHASAVPGAVVALAGLIVRRPVVLKISTNGELLSHSVEVRLPLIRRMLALLVRRPVMWLNARHAHLVALNGEGYAEALAAGATRVEVIDNGVDREIFRPPTPEERASLRAEYGIPDGATVLLFTGRFVRRKGVKLLAIAFRTILARPETMGRLFLFLAGSDELQADSEAEAVRILAGEADGRVKILAPAVPPIKYLWLADAFVSPSMREGMPNALLEAIAVGLPCIVSDIAPHRELATRNPRAQIKLFRSGDEGDLARALSEYLENPPRYHPSAHPALDPGFAISNVAQRYAQLYARMLTSAR